MKRPAAQGQAAAALSAQTRKNMTSANNAGRAAHDARVRADEIRKQSGGRK